MKACQRRNGFTLIEVLLALVIATLVLISATSLLVVLSKAWAERPATRDAFDSHVNGVARFLSATLNKAVPSVLAPKNPSIRLEHPIGFDEINPPLITFSLQEAPPVLYWGRQATAGVTCYLFFDEGEGLSVLWFSNLQEMEPEAGGQMRLKEEDDLFKTLLSPLVTKVSYCYYGEEDDPPESKEWREEDQMDESLSSDKFLLPHFIKIFFEHEEAKRTITIPIEKVSPHGLHPQGN